MSIEKPHIEDDEESNWDCPSGCLSRRACSIFGVVAALGENDKRISLATSPSAASAFKATHGNIEGLVAQFRASDQTKRHLAGTCTVMQIIVARMDSGDGSEA